MKTVFVHPERCIGCRQCEIACAVEHSQSKDLTLALFETPPPRPRIHVEVSPTFTTFPNKCRHCSPAPCMEICPSGALYRDEATDSVLLSPEKCIACAMCAMVCPFDVIVFDEAHYDGQVKVMNIKCDNCQDRQVMGMEPACVETCKVGALEFGDVNKIIKKERKKFTERISVIMEESATEFRPLPPNMEIWRSWQEDIHQLQETMK